MKEYLDRIKPEFMHRMSMISWKAAQWMQFTGHEWDRNTDVITFWFKSSTYNIGFFIKIKAFSGLYGEPFIKFGEAYDFFRDVKYNEVKKLN